MKEDLVSADCLATSLQLVIAPTQETQDRSREWSPHRCVKLLCYKTEAIQWSLDAYDFLV